MKYKHSSGWLCSVRLAAFCMVLFITSPAKALDLGMTPNHVFVLWTSINTLIPRLAEYSDSSVVADMNTLSIGKFTDKSPPDVYEQVVMFRSKVDKLLSRNSLTHPDTEPVSSDRSVYPSDVYLKSGHVLDALVILLVSQTDANEMISHYYKEQTVSNKVPDDVFALVHLANRKIDLLVRSMDFKSASTSRLGN